MTKYRLCAYRAHNQKIEGLDREANDDTLGDTLREIVAHTPTARNIDIYADGAYLGMTTPARIHADKVVFDTGTGGDGKAATSSIEISAESVQA